VSGGRNLILGYWSKLPFSELEEFLASLRRTTFDGDICIFVEDVSLETIRLLLAHGIMVERAEPSAQPHMVTLSSRFFSYLDYLARNGQRYDHVMLSDLRDVVFQADPFARPLPAEIVFAQERCLLENCPVNREWVRQAYGEAVAHNMRDCQISCAGTTFGTSSGILRYLVAMTSELTSRPPPIEGGIDQGIHNYIVHMHPLGNAWLDTTDSIVATMHYIAPEAVQVSNRGVLIDGMLVPVLHQWQKHQAVANYVRSEPRFRLSPPIATTGWTDVKSEIVICCYHPQRDTGWLNLFLGSLRSAGHAGGVHCVGTFDESELSLLSAHGCVGHQLGASDPSLDLDNVAHLYVSRVLDALAADGASRPDHVLVLDTVRAMFLRNPFLTKTIGLSAFCEGPMRIGESDFNLHRLWRFTEPDEAVLRRPVVSSSLLRGPLEVVRAFYRKLFTEFVGRAELLRMQKSIQGAVNKLCYADRFEFPIILHPNGAEAFFGLWPTELPITTQHGIRVGGTTPAVVLCGSLESELVRSLVQQLGLATTAA
jgi:hypothetical protein